MLDPSPLAPRGVAVALLLALGACSSDDTGPSDQVLVGSWGSAAAEFIALQAGAEVRTGCTTIVIHAPVTLTEANTFTTRGELHGSGAALGKLPSVAVSGTLSGARLSLVAPTVAEGPASTYQL
ncbi:MAG TPA: hypothetical protein VFT28_14580, partial [Gemmatimonadales bacterium]|nr:hypothetical protein [Gemmatimonadales bacterium]